MLLKRVKDHPTRSYKYELEVMKFLSPKHVQDSMENVPDEIKDKLKEGPLSYRYDCGVCEAFDDKFEGYGITINTEDPLYRVWVYHEIPKADFVVVGQNYYGLGANEIYARCLTTYKIAGWEGIAEPANA